jgi:hypothetical protein
MLVPHGYFLGEFLGVLFVWSKINVLQYYSHTGIAILWEVFPDFPEMNSSIFFF